MHFERGLDGQNGWEVYFYVSFDGMEDREVICIETKDYFI